MTIRTALLMLAAAAATAAQTAPTVDLLQRTDEVESAIRQGDWARAARLTRELKQAVENARDQALAASGSELAASMLVWLPPDTETLVVAQKPFTIVGKDRGKIPTTLQVAQGYLSVLLAGAEKGELFKALQGHTVRFAAVGAGHFGEERPSDDPNGERRPRLGMIPFQGCGVYAFAEPVPESLLSRPPNESIMGHAVWTSSGSHDDPTDPETHFLSLLQPDLAIVCNDRAFLNEMLTRMASTAGNGARALPPDLPEWKNVDRSAPVWAIRHLRSKGPWLAAVLGDPSDVGATGLTVEFGLPSGRARARILSPSDPWKKVVGIREFQGAAKSRQASPGIWELSVDDKPETAPITALLLMGVLGFLVAI